MTGFVPADELPAHMAEVERRYATHDHAALVARVEAQQATIPPRAREALIERALRANSPAARVHWLRQEAAILGQAMAPISPCRAGCSHCCYQGVTLAEDEARVIGKAIGRKVAEPAPGRVLNVNDLLQGTPEESAERMAKQRQWTVDEFNGKACTFLRDGACSIYEHRPIACRLHISVSRDDLLCRLVPGVAVEVPYVDARNEQQAYAMAFPIERSRLADVRDWFPTTR